MLHKLAGGWIPVTLLISLSLNVIATQAFLPNHDRTRDGSGHRRLRRHGRYLVKRQNSDLPLSSSISSNVTDFAPTSTPTIGNTTFIFPTTSSPSITEPAGGDFPSLTPTPTPTFTETSLTNSSSSFTSFTETSTLSSVGPPTTSSQSAETSKVGVITIAGAVIGGFAFFGLFIAFLICWRKQRRQARELKRWRVEKPFGSESQAHLIVDVGPNADGLQPYIKTPTDSYLSPQSAIAPNLRIPAKFSSMLASPVSPNTTTPSSAIDQQSLLEQLNALKEHILQVEAIARSGTSNTSSSGNEDSEPPPEYNAPNSLSSSSTSRPTQPS